MKTVSAKITPCLIVATAYQKQNVIKALLNLDADIEIQAKCVHAKTALTLAAANDDSGEIVKLLLQRGAKVNAQSQDSNDGRTALMLAAEHDKTGKATHALLEAGADLSIKDTKGLTALDYAKKNKHQMKEDIVALLKQKAKTTPPPAPQPEADTATQTPAEGQAEQAGIQSFLETPVMQATPAAPETPTATAAAAEIHLAAAPEAPAETVPPAPPPPPAATAPLTATLQKEQEQREVEIEAERTAAFDKELVNESIAEFAQEREAEAVKAFFDAIDRGDLEAFKHYLNANPQLLSKKKVAGKTPEEVSVTTLLELAKKIDAQANDKDGRTALMMAAQYDATGNATRALLEAGADLSIKDTKGLTALDYAKMNTADSKSKIVALLEQTMAQSAVKITQEEVEVAAAETPPPATPPTQPAAAAAKAPPPRPEAPAEGQAEQAGIQSFLETPVMQATPAAPETPP